MTVYLYVFCQIIYTLSCYIYNIIIINKINKIDSSEIFNSGWADFFEYTKHHNIPLFVVLHPTVEEIKAKEYDENGKQIIYFLNQNNIKHLLELNNTMEINFRDAIHYNDKGQEFLFNEMLPFIKQNICN